MPRWLEQASPEHEKLNHVSYNLIVHNNQGKPKYRTTPELLHVCLLTSGSPFGSLTLPRPAPEKGEMLLHPQCLQITPVEIQVSY